MLKAELDEFLFGNGRPSPPMGVVLVAPVSLAIYEANRAFYGRNWRRIKREVRKAEARARRAQPKGGIDRSSVSFWRNH